MFKVNNKDTRMTPGVVLMYLLLTLNSNYQVKIYYHLKTVAAFFKDVQQNIQYTHKDIHGKEVIIISIS